MEKLRLRDAKTFAQDHTAGKRQSGANPHIPMTISFKEAGEGKEGFSSACCWWALGEVTCFRGTDGLQNENGLLAGFVPQR